jgi:hypothetical protein
MLTYAHVCSRMLTSSILKVRGLFVSWMEEEEARMQAHKLPLKRVADAEEYELDPERFSCFTTVLFLFY